MSDVIIEPKKVKVRVLHRITNSSEWNDDKKILKESFIEPNTEIELDEEQALRLEGFGTVELVDKRVIEEEVKTIFTAEEVKSMIDENTKKMKADLLAEIRNELAQKPSKKDKE